MMFRVLVFLGFLLSVTPCLAAGSWKDGRFLPAPWISESAQPSRESRVASLTQGPYALPLGGDMDELALWLQKSGVVIENPEVEDVEVSVRRVLSDHVTGDTPEDVARQKEALERYSFIQIKDLVARLVSKQVVPVRFSAVDADGLLAQIHSFSVRPSFYFQNRKFSFLDAFDCETVPAHEKGLRTVCGRPALRAWQIVARPQEKTLMAEEGVQRIYVRVFQDEHQVFRVFSCLITAYAPSRVELLSLMALLSQKYGEYVSVPADALGGQESILKIRDGADFFPLNLLWGKNLILSVAGTYDPKTHRVELSNERYQLVYADQKITEKFLANLDEVMAQAPFEQINVLEAERKRRERSF